ncbi:unnamed protein product [Chrysoparadoxa australica]
MDPSSNQGEQVLRGGGVVAGRGDAMEDVTTVVYPDQAIGGVEESKGSGFPVHIAPTPPIPTPPIEQQDLKYFMIGAGISHKSDARCLAVEYIVMESQVPGEKGRPSQFCYTGSRDCTLKVWDLGRVGTGIFEPLTQTKLPAWVNAVAVSDALTRTIAVGCKNGVIYLLQWELHSLLTIVHEIPAHMSPVSSLSFRPVELVQVQQAPQGSLTLQLISGGWDGTARRWVLKSGGHCDEIVMPGHENIVCVLHLGGGRVATGSSGLQAGNKIVSSNVRLWVEHAATEAGPVMMNEVNINGSHEAGVRCLCPVEKSTSSGHVTVFASCSNDGTVKVWDRDLNCIGSVEVSTSYIYTIAALESLELGASHGRYLIAGDDLGAVTVLKATCQDWSDLSVASSFSACSTTWGLCGCFGGGILAACADGSLRVYARRVANAVELAEEAVQQALTVLKAGAQSLTGSALPVLAPAGQELTITPHDQPYLFTGSAPNAISLFRQDGKVVAMQWTEVEGLWLWQSVGDVTEPLRKDEIRGQAFDHILPIEIDSRSKGSLQLQLGWNNTDDIQEVAKKFCEQHQLPAGDYVPYIVAHITSVVP